MNSIFARLWIGTNWQHFWGILKVCSGFIFGRNAALLLCTAGCLAYVVIDIFRSFMAPAYYH